MKRKTFLRTSLAGGLPLILGINPKHKIIQDDREKLDPKLVNEFVGAGHKDLDKVKTMLAEHPILINSAHDWGRGDFETALGAASHVGYKELAQFLIDKGAQANIFTAALFGRMDIIEPFLSAFPMSLNAKGPHGFTLLHHANRGGEEAVAVKEFLEKMGATEMKIPLY